MFKFTVKKKKSPCFWDFPFFHVFGTFVSPSSIYLPHPFFFFFFFWINLYEPVYKANSSDFFPPCQKRTLLVLCESEKTSKTTNYGLAAETRCHRGCSDKLAAFLHPYTVSDLFLIYFREKRPYKLASDVLECCWNLIYACFVLLRRGNVLRHRTETVIYSCWGFFSLAIVHQVLCSLSQALLLL